jgi:hypothetical protein
MIRPLTCVCLILAAGSGLYLYQVKQRAFALDASLRSTFHDIDAARDRTRMLRADWALVNDPERLQALATQYLKLQPMQPSQLLTMDQLAAALPPPGPFPAPVAPIPSAASKPAPVVDPTHGLPMAEATPQVLAHTLPVAPQVALLQPSPPAAPQVALLQPPPPVVSAPLPASLSIPQLPASAVAAPAPHFLPQPYKPPHHGTHHPVQPWLAQANGSQASPRRHGGHHAVPAPRQFYAANVPQSGADAAPRITPEAATVMYRPASGSSLGMASSAELAPPRPLYSTSQ